MLHLLSGLIFVKIACGCNVQIVPPQSTGSPAATTTRRPTAPTHTSVTSWQTTTTKMKLSNETLCGHKGVNRIIGGNSTAEGEIPWQCAVLKNDGKWMGCGAVLLSCNPTIVVSAAHCFQGQQFGLKVSCGSHRVSQNYALTMGHFEERLTVKQIINHPDYEPGTSKNDIALIKLHGEFNCHKRELFPACLPRNSNYNGWHKGMVTGWGLTEEGGLPSEILMKARMPIVPDSVCSQAYGTQLYPNEMLCAGRNGTDACQGDSGGPLVVQDDDHFGWSLVGIVSWGIGCARSFGVYTEVSHYIPWIAQSYGLLPPDGY